MKYFLAIRSCLLLLLFLFVLQSGWATKFIDKSVFTHNWTMNPSFFYLNCTVDSTTTPYSMLLETLREKKGIVGYLMPIHQIEKEHLGIKISIRQRAESCNKLFLTFTSIGACEEIVSVDTVSLPLVEEWTESTHFLTIKRPLLLNVSIEATGLNEENAKIWISDLEVMTDGENMINDSTEERDKIHFGKKGLIQWNDETFQRLPFFDRKILAIGETVHGTETMNEIAYSIIKERILKKQCKFVLLEIPLIYSFHINRYVKNDPNFKMEDIADSFHNSLLSDSILSLIHWVKEYNLTHVEQVSFWGFDLEPIQMKDRIDLFNFFYSINPQRDIHELNTICEFLLKGEREVPWEKILHLFDESSNLKLLLDKNELRLMRHCIVTTSQESNSYFRFINRDNMMSKNTAFIIDSLLNTNETVTLFGHFGHMNYVNVQDLSITNHFSLGYYMRKKYGENYSCVALVANSGYALLSKSDSECEAEKLVFAPQNSIEYLINKQKVDSVYLSMDKLNCSTVLKIRKIGNWKPLREQFRYIIPKSRMEGVLFVKAVTGLNKKEETPRKNSNLRLMNSYKEALDKMKVIKE